MTARSRTEKTRLKRERATRRRRIRRATIGLLLAVLVGGGGYYAWSVRNAPLEGSPAPDFALQDHGDSTVRLSDFRGKQEVILLFYMGSS